MAQQTLSTLENNFIGGLKTENNPLNFPTNACTDTSNCIFTVTGEVTNRPGIDIELNNATINVIATGKAMSTYKWNNAGGDGSTQLLVEQIGLTLYFFRSSTATTSSALSQQLIASLDLIPFFVSGTPVYTECQYSDGNGYLFVFHPNLNPFYCTYAAGSVSAIPITIQVRDFNGITENTPINSRPGALTPEHAYNLNNQGWTQGSPWTGLDNTTTHTVAVGSHSFTIAAALPISNGDNVQVFGIVGTYGFPQNPAVPVMTGSVTSYSGTTLVLNVYSVLSGVSTQLGVGALGPITLSPTNTGYINTWLSAVGNYPSNSDIWWLYKNTSDVFSPATTIANVTINSGPAPKGHYILNAFNQQRSLISGVSGLTNVVTSLRPKTGTWFQGRAWYVGPDDAQAATGDQLHYSWSENIYFSQIVENASQVGYCYQNNDPTSQHLFDLLPSDGGVIRIQGSGSIFKLFPIQNGLLVFAANGIWFITGSQGIGFSANDYTVTKISSVVSISGTSFINVLGFPMFWNEEGIYSVTPSPQGGGLTVTNLCIGTIQTFYMNIPSICKKYARGDYNPLDFVITWIYRNINDADDVTTRYKFNSSLNMNTATKAFYPWSFTGSAHIHDVKYISSPGGTTAPQPVFKYLVSLPDYTHVTFAEIRDTTNYLDFHSIDSTGIYTSTFTTGFKLDGQTLTKFQPLYIMLFSNADAPTSYTIQGIWDFAEGRNSGRYSNTQFINHNNSNFGVLFRRIKIRGHGISLQFKVQSVTGKPFDIIGWSTLETKNVSV